MMAATGKADFTTMTTFGGDRAVVGREIRQRREALGLTQAQLSTYAMVGLRTLEHIESGTGGASRIERVLSALDKLEQGGTGAPQVERVLVRPGVWVTVEYDDSATIGDVRRTEEAVRRIAGGE